MDDFRAEVEWHENNVMYPPRFQESRIPDTELKSLNQRRKDSAVDLKDKIELRATEGSVFVHERVLTSACTFFKALFESRMQESISGEIDLRAYSLESVIQFVEYIYSGKISSLSKDTLRDLYALACWLRYDSLEVSACQKLQAAYPSFTNEMDLFDLAARCNSGVLFERLICPFITHLSDPRFIEKFSFTTLQEFLRIPINVCKAKLVKKIVNRWTQLHPEHKNHNFFGKESSSQSSLSKKYHRHIHFALFRKHRVFEDKGEEKSVCVSETVYITIFCAVEGIPTTELNQFKVIEKRGCRENPREHILCTEDTMFVYFGFEGTLHYFRNVHSQLKCKSIHYHADIGGNRQSELKSMCSTPKGILLLVRNGKPEESGEYELAEYEVKTCTLYRKKSGNQFEDSTNRSHEHCTSCFYNEHKIIIVTDVCIYTLEYSDLSIILTARLHNFHICSRLLGDGNLILMTRDKIDRDSFRIETVSFSGVVSRSVKPFFRCNQRTTKLMDYYGLNNASPILLVDKYNKDAYGTSRCSPDLRDPYAPICYMPEETEDYPVPHMTLYIEPTYGDIYKEVDMSFYHEILGFLPLSLNMGEPD